jgi:hypothetical protein
MLICLLLLGKSPRHATTYIAVMRLNSLATKILFCIGFCEFTCDYCKLILKL